MKRKLTLLLAFILLIAIRVYAKDYLVEEYQNDIIRIDQLPLKKIISKTDTQDNCLYCDIKTDTNGISKDVCYIYFDAQNRIRKYISKSKKRRVVCYYDEGGELFYITGKDVKTENKDGDITEKIEAGEIYVDLTNEEAVCVDISVGKLTNGNGRFIRSACLGCEIPEAFGSIKLESIITVEALTDGKLIPTAKFDMTPDVKFDTNIEGYIVAITDNRTEVRTKPDDTSIVLKTLTAGEKIKVIERQKKSKKDRFHWYKVSYKNANRQYVEAYIYGEYLDSIERTI